MKLNDNLYFYPEQGMLDCNTYIIKDKLTLLIDIGLDKNLPVLIQEMEKDGIPPDQIDIIGNTHLHMDHAWANQEFKDTFGAKIKIGQVQKQFYDVGVRQTSRFFNMEPIEFEEDGIWDTAIDMGYADIEVIETPGHSPDSICFYCPQTKALICGDLIFKYNTGRPDLPGGSMAHLAQSIEQVAKLDIELLLPGHMEILADKKSVKKNFDFVKNNIL